MKRLWVLEKNNQYKNVISGTISTQILTRLSCAASQLYASVQQWGCRLDSKISDEFTFILLFVIISVTIRNSWLVHFWFQKWKNPLRVFLTHHVPKNIIFSFKNTSAPDDDCSFSCAVPFIHFRCLHHGTAGPPRSRGQTNDALVPETRGALLAFPCCPASNRDSTAFAETSNFTLSKYKFHPRLCRFWSQTPASSGAATGRYVVGTFFWRWSMVCTSLLKPHWKCPLRD